MKIIINRGFDKYIDPDDNPELTGKFWREYGNDILKKNLVFYPHPSLNAAQPCVYRGFKG